MKIEVITTPPPYLLRHPPPRPTPHPTPLKLRKFSSDLLKFSADAIFPSLNLPEIKNFGNSGKKSWTEWKENIKTDLLWGLKWVRKYWRTTQLNYTTLQCFFRSIKEVAIILFFAPPSIHFAPSIHIFYFSTYPNY